jgi:hypothetical protein
MIDEIEICAAGIGYRTDHEALFPRPDFAEVCEAFVRIDQPRNPPRQRKQPTLASVAKQASKAGIEVARYEVKPDGTVVIITGKSEATESNPWPLDDFKATKQ